MVQLTDVRQQTVRGPPTRRLCMPIPRALRSQAEENPTFEHRKQSLLKEILHAFLGHARQL